LDGSALEQAVGEPAGARADVGADEALGVEPEGIEGGFELEASARDVLEHFALEAQLGLDADAGAGLVDARVVDDDLAGEHERLGLGARLGEAPLHEQHVEPLFLQFLRSTVYRATAASGPGTGSSFAIAAWARCTCSAASARERSRPTTAGNVWRPAAASAPVGLPMVAASAVTSRMSSAI